MRAILREFTSALKGEADIWKSSCRRLPLGRSLCRPHSQGREAGRLASAAIHDCAADHQPQVCESTRSHSAAPPHRTSGRADRISRLRCCNCSQPLLARLRDRKSADRRPLLGFGKSRYAARLGVGCPRPRLGRHLLSDHPRLCIGFPSNLDKWR